jgi:hypothetical protein
MNRTYREEAIGVVGEHVDDLARRDGHDPHPSVDIRTFSARFKVTGRTCSILKPRKEMQTTKEMERTGVVH